MRKSGSFRRARASIIAIVVALVTNAAAMAGHACGWRDSSGQAVFPIQPNLGARHLIDAEGRPFLIVGDSPWSLIADLTREDADMYLRDRRKRGFNTLLVNLIEHKFTRSAPANAYGEPPFLTEGDFSTPNPAYFDHAGLVLRRACDLGFLVLLTPSYAGSDGGDHGWYADMVANGPDRLREYGRFVGEEFGHLDNIVWVQGGDYDPPDKDLVRAIVAGIDSAAPAAIHTAHGAPESRVIEHWAGEPWLAINNVYTYGDVRAAAVEQFHQNGDRPFFLFESAYENEFGAGGERVRAQAYMALLSGATGQLFGNNPIWHFDGPGLYPKPMDWEAALDSPGARSMTVLNQIFSELEWWRLEPDLSGRLLTTTHGRSVEAATAALADDGSFAVVYVTTTRPFRLHLDGMSGSKLRATWADPTTGQVTSAKDTPVELTGGSFQPPARNAAGNSDWVLILRAEMPGGGR